jgi:hypothetical protein
VPELPGELPVAQPAEQTGLRVEFRCPVPKLHPGKISKVQVVRPGELFAVAFLASQPDPGAVLEVACQRCKQRSARAGRPVHRMIHRYLLTGELVDTREEMQV